jgi:purine-nucleoside phosphorylase
MNTDLLSQAAETVRQSFPGVAPRAAAILGSGWSDVVDAMDAVTVIPYSEIPGLGASQVAGHAGRMVLANCGNSQVLIFQGRRHWYEGIGWNPIALPVYLCAQFGVSHLLLTNAAGGIRADLTPGALMMIEDHINGMGGSPLVGPHDPTWGPRFPDMTNVYDTASREIMSRAASQQQIELASGVYMATHGPAYETPAEIHAYRALGADAVGMSTVPEALLAHAAGIRVAGISCITNLAAGVSDTPLSHDEVIEETARSQPRMQALLPAYFSLLLAEHAAP